MTRNLKQADDELRRRVHYLSSEEGMRLLDETRPLFIRRTLLDKIPFLARKIELPDTRIPFVRLRSMARAEGVDLPRYGPLQNNPYHLECALKDAAANGRLAVWGRPYNGPVKDNDPLVRIPTDHFRTYSFRHGLLTYDDKNEHSATTTMQLLARGDGNAEGETYYDLYVSEYDARAVIEEFAKGRSQ